MSLRLRPFAEEDYPRLVEISNLVYPEYRRSVEEFRHWDKTWDSARYERLRLVAEGAEGRVVGWGQINHMPHQFHPRKYELDVQVEPASRRRGVGSALYERLVAELRAREALLARTGAKESMAESIAFLTRRDFVEVQRAWESRLDVAAFDFAPFAGVEERAAQQGITITTLAAERERDPDALRQVYEMHTACEQDTPAVDPITETSFEHFVVHEIESPNALPDAYFLAKDGDCYVGESYLARSLEDLEILYQGLTGVLREYRCKGIAMALKMHTVRYARTHGKREIRTWNNTRNQAMLRINEAMGFQKQPVWIEFQKTLT